MELTVVIQMSSFAFAGWKYALDALIRSTDGRDGAGCLGGLGVLALKSVEPTPEMTKQRHARQRRPKTRNHQIPQTLQ